MKKLLFVAVLLSACQSDPIESSRTDNSEITVHKLFTHEGCTIYRFNDGGRIVHYASCQSSSDTTWEDLEGKVHVRRNITTEKHER
jgi:hypothetical protein